jgi:hypothetical protein
MKLLRCAPGYPEVLFFPPWEISICIVGNDHVDEKEEKTDAHNKCMNQQMRNAAMHSRSSDMASSPFELSLT